jgi:ElaB/YqjD/DUF883 family membrane-anchored ribosome-binding protein
MDEEMRGAAGTMETRSDITMQDIKRDIDDLRNDLKALMRSKREARSEKISEAKSRLWETAQNIESRTEEQIRDAYNSLRHQGTKALEMSREHVEKRPVSSLLWSFGIGMVMGRLLLRR